MVLCRESDRRGDMIGEVMNHVIHIIQFILFIFSNIHEYS